MPERFLVETLPSGLTLLGEKMAGVQSAGMTLLTPAGGASDPLGASGSATVLSDLVLRGAGSRNSRELTDYLDSLGLQRSSSVGTHHTRFGCAALARRVIEALPTYADILRRPHLPADGFEAARDLSLQSIAGIQDDPRHTVLIRLREAHFPPPFGRNTMGKAEDLEKLTLEACRADCAERYTPRGSILAIAGDIEFGELRDAVASAFAGWEGATERIVKPGPISPHRVHEHYESEQTHIGLAWPAIEETDPEYYTLRLALEVLSGGMSGRLFTEIREKRGLVYNVSAGYSSLKDIGAIFGYAGTSNDRAQATLDTFIDEVHRLAEGISQAELDRAKTGLKAATIMQGESSSARAGAIAYDYFIRGRIRGLEEIKAAIDAVTLDRVNAWLKNNPPGPFTIVTVGPNELKMPQA